MECHKLRMSDLQLYAALEMVGEGAVGGWGGTPGFTDQIVFLHPSFARDGISIWMGDRQGYNG